jgi:putative colanic acid biosynthesis UDP-glucose lipid carrier transferase
MSTHLRPATLEHRRRVSPGPAALAWSAAQEDARARSASRDPLRLLAGAAGAADAAVILGCSLLAFVTRNGTQPVPLPILTTAALASLLMANVLSLSGAYTARIQDGFILQVARAAQAWSIVFVLLLAVGYLTKTSSDYSRFWAIGWYVSAVLGLAGVRLAAVAQLRRWRRRGRLACTIAVVDLAGGGTDGSAMLARRLTGNHAHDIRLLGVFSADGAPARSGITDLIALSRLFRIDDVFVLVANRHDAPPGQLAAILRRLGTIPTNVRICPLLPELEQTPIRDTSLVHGIPVLTVHRRPLGAWSSVLKRAEDLVIGGLALLLLAPLMALAAILIRLDSPGPVLFRQARHGFNNNVITVLKFRTMTHQPHQDGPLIQATRGDRRVTRVGRVLRRTSIDELPQILNVLRGEMSLVGPRPHAVVHNEQYAMVIDDYLGRHRVQPGITGWAQINGLRGETDTLDKMRKRVEYDLSYIDNWSIALDLKIIALTAISMLFDRHAY